METLSQIRKNSATAMQADSDPEMGDSATGMAVTVKDLAYTVPDSSNSRKEIKLIEGVTASFPAAKLTALMGPSGSGKTTLLDVLAGRKTVGRISGELLYDNQQPTFSFFRRCIGYVEQFDTLIGNLTVTEMLRYTAELKNPTSMPLSEKLAKVDDVIEKLNLTGCKDVKIGTQLSRGISGGQAKRTNIGIALVSSTTRVLLLDEPTSGLDSYTATEVMKVVKGLTSSNITICATIHSPTPATFKLFDQTMILLRGQLAYYGSVGEAITYFQETHPEAPRIGSGVEGVADNIAEWIIDLTTKADREGKASAFAEVYQKSALRVANEDTVNAVIVNSKSKPNQLGSLNSAVTRATTVGSIPGFWTIIKYRSRRDFTDPQYLAPRLAERVLLGFILMSLYWHKCASNAAANINNVYSVLFLISILPGFTASAYIPVIVLERPLYYRELDDGLYRPITYLCAKLAGEFTVAVIGSLIFSWFVFFALELHGSYLLFLLVHYLTTTIGIILAYFIASVSPSLQAANAALPAYVVILLFFVGLLIRPADIPDYWHWYVNLDFLRYGWRAHMINQFEGQNAIFVDNTEVLTYFGITGSKWMWFGLESIFGFVFFIFALLGLTFVRYQKR